MSDIMEQTENAVMIPAGADPFTSYGSRVRTGGMYLIFKNGEFTAGSEGKEVQIGTKLVANMEGFRVGWRRWWASQVTDDKTELLTDLKPPAPRGTLGDDDPAMWERDPKTNVPRDPWQLTNVVELIDENGQRYTYTASSKGGIGALGDLCVAYGKGFRQRPDHLPIVQLGRDHYMHKQHGKTYVPIFTIVGWLHRDAAFAGSEPELELEAPPPATTAPKVAAPAVAAAPPAGTKQPVF